MLTGLLASARELRNPLTVGYSALFSFWLIAGRDVEIAARNDALGRRLIAGLNALGDAAELALYTFVGAIIGSVLWRAGIARLVRFLAVRGGHPDWPALIDQARGSVRQYEQYQVVTQKGRDSSFDERHTVPSPTYGAYLRERVDERERKAAEMSFRVTLAVALVPVAVALGIEGGGRWWLSLIAIAVVWLDVALMKYTTLRLVHRYTMEDLQAQLEDKERSLGYVQATDYSSVSETDRPEAETQGRERVATLRAEVDALKAEIASEKRKAGRRLPTLFAFLEGDPAE